MRHSGLSRGAVYQQLLRLSEEKNKKEKKPRKDGGLSAAAQVHNLQLMLEGVFRVYRQARYTHPQLAQRAARLYADIREYQTSLLLGEYDE
jgi:hypothetical protein